MGWAGDAAAALTLGSTISVRPTGGSMRGRIESGQRVTLEPLRGRAVLAGDAIFVRWRGNYLLHLAKEVDEQLVLIGNNVGKTNGWVRMADILGIVTNVDD